MDRQSYKCDAVRASHFGWEQRPMRGSSWDPPPPNRPHFNRSLRSCMQSLQVNSELCFLHTNPVKSDGNLSRRSCFVDFNKAPQHSELLRLDPVSPHQQGVDTSERWLSSVARPVSQAGSNLLSHHSLLSLWTSRRSPQR